MGWLAIGAAKRGGVRIPTRRAAPSSGRVATSIFGLELRERKRDPRTGLRVYPAPLGEERSIEGVRGLSPGGLDQATIASTSADSVLASPSSVNSMCS